MATLAITAHEELRQVDHRVVIAWERHMREVERAAPSTIRRRLSALSSLFKHLVCHGFGSKKGSGEQRNSYWKISITVPLLPTAHVPIP